MTLLICNSYMFVPTVITQIGTNTSEKFIVYSDLENIIKFFKELDLPNVDAVYFNSSFKWNYTDAKRREIIEPLKKYEITDIYFYHGDSGCAANWVLLQYAKKARIYNAAPYNQFLSKKAYSLKALLYVIIWYLRYRVFFVPMSYAGMIIPALSKKFFKKINAIDRRIDINNEVINSIVGDKISNIISGRSIVLLSGAIEVVGINTQKYKKFIDKIINLIGADKMVIKTHPTFTDIYGLEKQLPAIPSYFPMNLILSKFEVFIGFQTTTLAEAVIDGRKAISLAYMLPLPTLTMADEVKASLDIKLNGKGQILYPKNIDDLLLCLNNSQRTY